MRYISICTTLKVYLNEPHQDAAYIPTAALLRVVASAFLWAHIALSP